MSVCAAFDLSKLPTLEPRQSSDNQTNQSSSFIYAPDDAHKDKNLTFTGRYVEHTGDIYFRLSCPDHWSWVAVGFGSKMAGSLMFFMYANSNGKGA